jgi:formate dehydrogenase beta subunit
MKASSWEKQDAIHEGIPIIDNHVPKEFVLEKGKLVGMTFEKVEAVYHDDGHRELVPTGEEPAFYPCDDVLIAIGQENAFPWIEPGTGINFSSRGVPILDPNTLQSTRRNVFFGGDAAFGPENIITAVAHGHKAAVSIDLYFQSKDLNQRPAPYVNLVSQKMGIHEWSYDSAPADDKREAVPLVDLEKALKDRALEVELGFDAETAFVQAERCLNCDAQTVFTAGNCIECDACADICPTSCISFVENGPEDDLRGRLAVPAQNTEQDIYVSDILETGKVLVKDEDVCLHCGLCAERCPTAAWDMQMFFYNTAKATPDLMDVK